MPSNTVTTQAAHRKSSDRGYLSGAARSIIISHHTKGFTVQERVVAQSLPFKAKEGSQKLPSFLTILSSATRCLIKVLNKRPCELVDACECSINFRTRLSLFQSTCHMGRQRSPFQLLPFFRGFHTKSRAVASKDTNGRVFIDYSITVLPH